MSGYREAVLRSGPSFYARLGEATGVARNEIGGTGAAAAPTGSYVGSPNRAVAGPIAHTADGAVEVNGSTQYVSFPDNANVDLGDVFTLEGFIKRPTLSVLHTILDKGTNGYILRVNTSNQLELVKNSAGVIAASTLALTSTTNWNYVAATKNGSDVHLYIDGVDVTGSVTNRTCADTANTLYIGAQNGSLNFFNGKLDDIALYKRALTAAEIKAHYLAATTFDIYPDLVLLMALDSDPLDDPPIWRNYAEYVRGFETTRGRAQELETIEAGQMTVTFLNTDSRFDPHNTSSPYNGTLLPQKPIQLAFDWLGTRYPAWTGFIEGWPVTWEVGPYSETTITASDALSMLAQSDYDLSAAPTLMSTFDTGTSTVTDGSAFTAPNYAALVWIEVSADSFDTNDSTFSIAYTNQAGSSTAQPGIDRRLSATVTALTKASAGAQFPVTLLEGDTGVRDIKNAAWVTGDVSAGTFKLYGLAETFVPAKSGTQIAAILDNIGWPAGSSWRNIAPGATGGTGWSDVTGFTPSSEDRPLARIQSVAQAEVGDFFIAKDGRVTFYDRHSRWVSGPGPDDLDLTFGDDIADVSLVAYDELEPEGYDVKRVINIIRVVAEGLPPVAAEVDTASIDAYGRRPFDLTVPLAGSSECSSMEFLFKGWFAQPTIRFVAVGCTVQGGAKNTLMLNKVLPRELGDKISVERTPPGGATLSELCRIESIAISGAPRSLKFKYQLSPDLDEPFY